MCYLTQWNQSINFYPINYAFYVLTWYQSRFILSKNGLDLAHHLPKVYHGRCKIKCNRRHDRGGSKFWHFYPTEFSPAVSTTDTTANQPKPEQILSASDNWTQTRWVQFLCLVKNDVNGHREKGMPQTHHWQSRTPAGKCSKIPNLGTGRFKRSIWYNS